jgi:hypothetical protein
LWEYINRPKTHECGNRDCVCVIPFLGIFVSNFRYRLFAVQHRTQISEIGLPTLASLLFTFNPGRNCTNFCSKGLHGESAGVVLPDFVEGRGLTYISVSWRRWWE